jgi:cell division protein ZapE
MHESLIQIYDIRSAKGDLRADPAQRAVLPMLEEVRLWLQANQDRRIGLFAGLFARPPQPPKGLYLWGGVGRGKSMVMDMFFHACQIARKRRVHFHAFMQETHAAIHLARKSGVEDPIQPVADAVIRDAQLLAFDEMQINDITDAMIVGRLFKRLIDGGVVIVTTSNRAPEDLYKNGLNRDLFVPFIAILHDRLQVMELESPTDYRQHRLAGAQVYFHPAAAHSAQIEAIWRDLTGGQRGVPLMLLANNRKLELPRFANGVARSSFWDLCAQPLGPADFLAIAGAIRVLILEDIPALSSSNYNEAKRFVTLIDALYESRVRLVASAAAPPERLYSEGSGSFEFERTASRLREMQGADWGPAAPPV